jgi:tetratricopeptide (TPR) repeat protein
MMKRPQRHLLAILSALAVLWIVLIRLPPLISLWLIVAAVVFGFGLAMFARDYLAGRWNFRRRDWRKALVRFETFEKKVRETRLGFVLIPIYTSIYSFDGVAIARNNIAQCLVKLDALDDAERWLRSSLQRDPFYPVPYTNLGTIAALRGDTAGAQLAFRRAVELGFSPAAARELLRRALAQAEKADRNKAK